MPPTDRCSIGVYTTNLSIRYHLAGNVTAEAKLDKTGKQELAGVGGNAVELRIGSEAGEWAFGRLQLGSQPVRYRIRPLRHGISLVVQSGASRWSARFIAAKDDPFVQVVERTRGSVACWQWQFPGSQVHTHKQLAVISMPAETARFRMGAFTQYGQLFDLKDWAVAQAGEVCCGLVGIQVGKWSHPNLAAIHATGTKAGLTLDMRWTDPATTTPPACYAGQSTVRRRYLLVTATTQTVISPTRLGIDYFEPTQGYARWPAAIIARYGCARPERLAAVKRTVDSIIWLRPSQFLFGNADMLQRAIERCQTTPLPDAKEPAWAADFAAAKQHLFGELARIHSALLDSGYLHPLGNAVAVRAFGPMCILFHILDYLGQITDAERRLAAQMIADVAELHLRRDAYPSDYATRSPEFPYGPNSFYRGMLNQNFNTDVYCLVGVAGCVLAQHPRAALWRRHAVNQFHQQMSVYVWPGGAWEESHTYANHVKLTLLPFVLAMRYAPERLDMMGDERFRSTCRFFARLLSPPDATIDGRRGIPAVGDHGYQHADFGSLFGWLATACHATNDPDAALYMWAWTQTGRRSMAAAGDFHRRLLDSLFVPDAPTAAITAPPLPPLQQLPGYGAAFRGGTLGQADETLLVVRCGQSWGHYHPDQGSFWWWADGRLLCCDADLAGGDLKFAHRGHNVMGYPGRDPLQYLDRKDFHVDQCQPLGAHGVRIRCQIPVPAWGPTYHDEKPIPPAQQPHTTRTFEYDGRHCLTIQDEPTKAPDDVVLWSLHVPCKDAKRIDPRHVDWVMDDTGATLRLELPATPESLEIQRFGKTVAVFCTYRQQTLRHQLRYQPAQ